MKAFFADIRETGFVHNRGPKAWGSQLSLPNEQQRDRLKELDSGIAATQQALDDRAGQLEEQRWAWEEQLLADYKAGKQAWTYQRPLSAQSANGADLTIYNDSPIDSNFFYVIDGSASLASERKNGDGLIAASGPNPDNEIYTVTLRPGKGSWTALGIDVYQEESLPGARFARGADRFVLTGVEVELAEDGGKPRRIQLVLGTSAGIGEPPENPPMSSMDDDPKTGWGVSFAEGQNPFLALRFSEKVTTSEGSILTVRLRHESDLRKATIGRFRLALSSAQFSWPQIGDAGAKLKAKAADKDIATLTVDADRGIPPDLLKALRTHESERTAEQNRLVLDSFEWASPELQALTVQLARLRDERKRLEATIPHVVVTEATRPRLTRILPRANWMDQSSEIVKPAVPAFLGRVATNGRRATRLDLANWIASPENPLTARAFVNRLWREFFGTGISRVLEDLGSQGEWPRHAELLDWLAAEFMHPEWDAKGTHDWDVKHIVRTIVTSHTYRQSSLTTPQLEEKDPDNRLLARQSRFRVDAEVVHDMALAISGLLVEDFGGPSVRPYEPEGYLSAMNFPKREYSASHGKDLHRRALYTEWQRTFLHPTLLAFDAPTREECTVNRTNSNTPLQSLILLNDPIFVEAARVLAEHMRVQAGPAFDRQLDWAFLRALSRTPDAEERRILRNLYNENLNRFRARPELAVQLLSVGEAPQPAKGDRAELAAMTLVARVILNLNETITRD